MGIRDTLKTFRLFADIADERYKLVLILLLAFLLRVNGLGFGLPYLFHDDEHQYVEAGIAFLQGQQATIAELQKLNNPPLFKSVLGFFYVLYTRLLILNPKEIQGAMDTQVWRTFFQYVGRFASASSSLLTVALLYALGKRLYGRKTGILGAFLLAVSFLHVSESHFAVNDAPLTFFAVASLYAGAGILVRRRWFDYLVTGFLIGLAAATKYTGLQLISVMLLAHWLCHRKTNFKRFDWLLSPRLLSGLSMVPVGFALGAPIALISWREMLRRIGRLAEYGRFGYHDLLMDPQGGWIFYLKTLAWGVGLLMFAAFVVTLVLALIYRSRIDFILMVFPLLLYVTMGYQKMFFARFILPALPPLILLVAAWIDRLSRLSWKLRLGASNRAVLAALTIVLAVQPLAMSVWLGVILNRPDTREMATDWIRTNIPEGSVIYADTYAIAHKSVTGRVSLPYVQLRGLPFDYPGLLTYYRDRDVQFIMTSNYHTEPRYTDPAKEIGRKGWLTALSQLKLIQEFQPYWRPSRRSSIDQRYGPTHETLLRQYPGPVVRIYALDPKPNWHGLDPFVQSNQIPDKASIFGYEIAPMVLPGNVLDVAIYWINEGWRASDDLRVALVDVEGFEIAQAVARPASGFEAEPGSKGGIVKSEAHLLIPVGTPSDKYQVRLEVYDHDKFQILEALSIEQARVTVAASSPSADVVPELLSRGASLAPGISLTAYELSVPDRMMQNTLMVGEDNWMVLLWRADRNIDVDYNVRLTLADAQENVVAIWEGQPGHGNYATSNWRSEEFIRDPWNLKLPEMVTPGLPYHLVLALFDREGNAIGEKDLGTMLVSRRGRSSAIPTMQHTVDAVWGDAFRLLGFDMRAVPDAPNSGWIELDLYWQSIAPIEADYLVGVRLLDAQGQVVLAQEGQPAAGEAPTSTWQPGEVVQDFHSLQYRDLVENKYRLEVVLLNSQTGEPLPIEKDGQIANSLVVTSWP